MREELQVRSRNIVRYRITPAHAGRIVPGAYPLAGGGDHPRACGKNRTDENAGVAAGGSPPRMREELASSTTDPDLIRITPAHAGRILIMKTSPLLVVGSPPRMREELELYPLIVVCNGITPAHAGRIDLRPDSIDVFHGSPPRMREEL